MRIILAEAAIDENGQTGYEGTKAGDQTGNEVRNIDYYEYRKGWIHVYRWKDRKLAERFAIRMQGAVVNPMVGYSQPKRYTYWDQLKVSAYDPLKITRSCEVDCSALVCANVNAALFEAGIKTRISPMEYTASMEKAFSNDENFIDVIAEVDVKTGKGLMVGDILLGPPQTHTAAVYSVVEDADPVYVGEAYGYCYVWKDEKKTVRLSECPALGQGNRVEVLAESDQFYKVRISGKFIGYVEKTIIKK